MVSCRSSLKPNDSFTASVGGNSSKHGEVPMHVVQRTDQGMSPVRGETWPFPEVLAREGWAGGLLWAGRGEPVGSCSMDQIDWVSQAIGDNSWYRTAILPDVHTDTWWTHDWPAPHFWSQKSFVDGGFATKVGLPQVACPNMSQSLFSISGTPIQIICVAHMYLISIPFVVACWMLFHLRDSLSTHTHYVLYTCICLSWNCVNFSSFLILVRSHMYKYRSLARAGLPDGDGETHTHTDKHRYTYIVNKWKQYIHNIHIYICI